MKQLVRRVALGAALLSVSSTVAQAQVSDLDATVMEELSVSEFTIQQLVVPELSDAEMLIPIELDGQSLSMVIHRHSIRAPGFELLVNDGSGPVRMPAPLPSTFRGSIVELDGSVVVGGMIRGQLNAEIMYLGMQWGVQPLTAASPAASRSQYVVYSTGAILKSDGYCGVDESYRVSAFSDPGGSSIAGSNKPVCEIAIEAGYDYYTGNGSSITNTINDTEVILNRMDNIYDQVDTDFILTTIHIWTTSSDPYSGDLSNRLTQFRAYWNSNYTFIKKDIAHYMVGGSSGGVIGVAWVGAVCTSYRYGVSRTKFSGNLVSRTALTAHEVGHNYNYGHCSGGTCKIMCASIGGCGGPITEFGDPAANVIRNYSHSLGCTPENGPKLVAPWTDDFESTTIDSDTWPAHQGASTSTAATGETSGSRSLNLDGVNSSPEGQDRIISYYTLLAGMSGLDVTYNTEHKGVSSSGSLLVEYRQSTGAWEELNTVTSNGTDQSSFVSHAHPLPGNAYHDEFQLRFIAQGGSGGGSDWYIDDISVGGESCAGTSNYCATSPNSIGSGMTLNPSGSTSYASNDLSFLAIGGPPSQFGIFFMGVNEAAIFFGDGILCVGGGIVRYPVQQIDAFTTASLVVDYTSAPALGNMLPGSTWNFQFWYRDPAFGGAGFNLTDAVSVTICD